MHNVEKCYRLCSLQTNLFISFHHQSDVSLHQCTTFEVITFYLYIWLKVSMTQMLSILSCWPDIVLLLVTRCLYLGGMSELRSFLFTLVPFLVTRWLYWGCSWTLVSCMHINTILLSGQFYLHVYYSWLRSVVSTWVPFLPPDTSLEGTPELVSVVSTLVPFLADISCIYISTILCQQMAGGYIWLKVSLTQRLTKCQADLM